jgi:drug/metabolite transporter (DMT)-like permease
VPIGVLLGTETLNLRRVLAILVTVAGVVCLVTA